MIIGSSTYAFSLVVALFLLGLSTGAYLVTRRRTGTDYRRVLLYVEIATAISLVFSLFVANQTPAFLINAGLSHNISSWSGLMLLQILSTVMLVLLPATLMGMVMPLVLDWAGNPAYGVTSVRLVGGSYAVNTLGAIWGAWSTAFVLIPVLSTRSAILICATLCVIAALFSYVPNGEGTDTELRRSLAAGIAAAVIIGFFFLAPSMNKLDLSLGAYDTLIRVLSRSQFAGLEEEARERGDGEHRLLMYEEGPTATVSVRRDWDIISMAVNGRTNASDKGDMPTQVMLSQLPLLTAPRIDNALVIGFGSGVSVGSILQSPINSVECVELEPTAIDAGKYFEHVNNRPLADRRLKLIIDDARAYLRVTPIRYDIIVSEPSHPWVPGVANLFTRDFFELGLSRLREDGVFVQWVQIYQLSTESLRSVLATYQSVFPHVLVFRVGGAGNGKDLILVGSRSLLDRSRIRSRLEDQRISAEVARVDLGSADEVESWYVCDEAELRPAVQSAPINTDDNMLIETRVPKEAFKPVMESNAEWINRLAAAARNRGAALQAATR
jgi:spermidine synthase